MFTRTLAGAALLVATSALPAAAQSVEKQPADKAGSIVGSLAFQLGVGSEYELDYDQEGLAKTKGDGDATLAIIPAVEKKLGQSVAFGGEYMFVWAKGEGADERQLIMSPHLRVRMSFPVGNRVTVGGMLGIGPSIWTSASGDETLDSTRFGWSYRFAFGGAYAINDAVSAFADVGYYRTTSYGDDVTARFSNIPISVGLRSQF